MKRALAWLIAGASLAAWAESGTGGKPPAQAATEQAGNVQRSRETAKMTTAERQKAIKAHAQANSAARAGPSWVGDDPRGTHREAIRDPNRKGRMVPRTTPDEGRK